MQARPDKNVRCRCWPLALPVVLCAIGCSGEDKKVNPMPRPANEVSEETSRFHRIVEQKDLSDLEAALNAGAQVNAPGRIGMTPLMLAIAAKDLEKMKLLIRHGADPELADDFNNTPLRHAVDHDFFEGVEYLLSLGVDRGSNPKYPLKKIEYDNELPDVPMPAELKEVMSETEWKESQEETRQAVRELWQNPRSEPVISAVQSVEVLKLLLRAGDDLNLAPNKVKRALVGLETGGELHCTEGDYRRQKSPRYGSRNPERMDLAFWKDMIRTGGSAYSPREHFNDTELARHDGAVWCYDRFGSSLTPLEDGRFVQIGGEHEDHYDPDFFIYNDVVIHDGHGDFQIFGYPRDVFPPTDFHTATLCKGTIYIIGCLGYGEQRRPGTTPVYCLKLESWEIEAVTTTGEMPGWIHKHRARYDSDSNSIHVTGGEIQTAGDDGELVPSQNEFELDLGSFKWRRVK